MGPHNNFEMLVPRKDDTHSLRVNESINFPGAYPESVSRVPSLWDYWPILLRYKWMILAAVLVSLAMGTVIALSTTPIFEAVGRIVINREGADAAGLKSAETSADSDDDYMVSVDTQTHVLQSDAIAKLVISKLSLDSNPAFAGKGANAAQPNRCSAIGECSGNRAAS